MFQNFHLKTIILKASNFNLIIEGCCFEIEQFRIIYLEILPNFEGPDIKTSFNYSTSNTGKLKLYNIESFTLKLCNFECLIRNFKRFRLKILFCIIYSSIFKFLSNNPGTRIFNYCIR